VRAAVLALAVLALVNGLVAEGQDAPVMSEDERAIVVLCASEASIRITDDCRVIAAIVRYQAERRHLSPAAYVARYHHRHTRSATRPWLGEVDARLTMPPSWPDDRVPWATRGRPGLLRLLDVVRAEGDHGCDGFPVTWGGSVDRARITRMTLSGNYRVVRCGTTVNTFLARGRR
jgi:hypothetical protein